MIWARAARRWPVWIGATVLTLAGPVGSAAESAPASVKTVDQEAREGLQNLDLIRRGLAEPGESAAGGRTGALVPTPNLSTPSDAPLLVAPDEPTTAAARAAARKDWAARNWLLAGVQPTEQGANGPTTATSSPTDSNRGNDAVARDSDPLPTDTDHWLAAAVRAQEQIAAEAAADDQQKREANAAGPEQVVNPLAAFMQGWTRPDTDARTTADGSMNSGALGAGSTTTTDNLALTLAPRRNLTVATDQALPRAGDQSNPFLNLGEFRGATRGSESHSARFDDLSPFTALGDTNRLANEIVLPRSLDLAPGPTPSAGADSSLQTSPPPPGSNGEPWRPPVRDDEKYFPRLKRF